MVKVIVNADDLGIHPSIDEGIFMAFDKGIATSASLLAVGENVEQAAHNAASSGLPVGLHLSLSEGKPIRMRKGYLVGKGGHFSRSPLDIILRYNPLRDGAVGIDDLRTEVEGQFERLLDLGVDLTHVDTHQHVHLNKYVSEVIAASAEKYGVTRMRRCREPMFFSMLGMSLLGNVRRLNLAKWMLARHLTSLRQVPLRSTDAYFGLSFSGNMTASVLKRFFETISGNETWELAMHPGNPISTDATTSGLAPFYASQHRRTELTALCDPEVKEIISRRGIELVSWTAV